MEKPLLRGHFHQAMFFVSVGASILLIIKANKESAKIASVIYSLGLLSMFGISALYHRIHWSTAKRALMRKLDHSAIYLKIAATFTPVCLLALSENTGMNLLMIIWIVAIFGIIQSIFFVNIPKFFSAILYLFMGYLVLPYLSELMPALGTLNMSFLIAGGVAYSLGALAYGLKKPTLSPKYFGYHEVFHVLVSIGAIFHFIIVYNLV